MGHVKFWYYMDHTICVIIYGPYFLCHNTPWVYTALLKMRTPKKSGLLRFWQIGLIRWSQWSKRVWLKGQCLLGFLNDQQNFSYWAFLLWTLLIHGEPCEYLESFSVSLFAILLFVAFRNWLRIEKPISWLYNMSHIIWGYTIWTIQYCFITAISCTV